MTDRPATRAYEHLAAQWLDGLRSGNTRDAYRRDLAGFATWCAASGCSPLSASADDVARYREHLAGQGARPATVARRLSAMSSFYRHAVAARAATRNPVDEVDRPVPADRRGAAPLEPEEAEALVEAAVALGPKVLVLVGLLLLDGLKLGEALSLDVDDVAGDVAASTATVTRRGEHRDVVLDRRTAAAIESYLAGRTSGPLLLGGGSDAGARLTRFGADFLLKRATGRAGLERPVSANVLRSTYMTTAHRAGVPVEQIRRLVGHVEMRETRRYLA